MISVPVHLSGTLVFLMFHKFGDLELSAFFENPEEVGNVKIGLVGRQYLLSEDKTVFFQKFTCGPRLVSCKSIVDLW